MCQKPVSISTVRGEKTLAVSCTVEPNYQSIDNRYSSDFNKYSNVPYISYEQIASTKDGSYALIIKPRGRSLILYLPSKWTLLIVEYIYSHAHRTSSIYCLNFCVFLRGAKQCWVRRGRAQDRAVCDGTAPHRSRFRFTYSLLPFSSFFSSSQLLLQKVKNVSHLRCRCSRPHYPRWTFKQQWKLWHR